MANETWKFVQAKNKQAMNQVLGIRDEKTRMKVTPPLAVAPLAQEEMRKFSSQLSTGGVSAVPTARVAAISVFLGSFFVPPDLVVILIFAVTLLIQQHV